jgi:hypothetical protein
MIQISRHLKSLLAVFALTAAMDVSAQPKTIQDSFREMPDSLLPYLSQNNRLDMLDFMASGMKARVQNKFDGHSEMLTLTDDSLSIQMSEVMMLTMKLLPTVQEYDGAKQVIMMQKTMKDSSGKQTTRCTFYTIFWRKIDEGQVEIVK